MEQLVEASKLSRSGGGASMTVAAVNNLASLYLKMGAIASAACPSASRTFAFEHEHASPCHARGMTRSHSLICPWGSPFWLDVRAGKPKEAAAVVSKALEHDSLRTRGEGDPATLALSKNLGLAYYKLGARCSCVRFEALQRMERRG